MIRIAQLLCSQGHCFLAVAFDEETISDRDACHELGKVTARHTKVHGSACALCGSTSFKIEVGATKFKTLEKAMPHLTALQDQQLATRARLMSELN